MAATNKKPELQFKPASVRKVLIALDYDPTSQKVAEKGFSFAKAMRAEVTLLHVIADDTYYASLEYSPITGFSGFSDTEFTQLVNDKGLIKASQYFLNKIKNHLCDENIQCAEVILAAAKRLHTDIIVMGSHSKRWLEQILLGSITEKVLNRTSVPLFIIPTKEHNSK